MLHWHCYTWTGAGDDLRGEVERRPDSPGFPSSPVPPMLTGDWLAKPRTRIAATFTDLAEVVAWLRQQYGSARQFFPRPADEARIGLDARLDLARDLLPRGVDVQWGFWLTGGRFTTIAAICCPNRHVSHSCPSRG
ncbi:hypothetical protein [Thermoactinospora rubra]|uniref:hypothetical protein n=1 Tax=Thermoactinospora rubra TaxID=1088767 RepID=UPI000A10A669|nr:hypothetical protein [Thermoactinospora rubra]